MGAWKVATTLRPYLHNGSDELLHEVGHAEEGGPKLVDEVDEQALDVRAVVVLVGHDHELAVAEGLVHRLFVVLLAVLEAEDLLDVRDLLVVGDLLGRGITCVEELSSKREYSVAVAADNAQARDRQRLGRVSLRQDEGTVLAVALVASVVGVAELLDAHKALLLLAARLLQGPGRLEGRKLKNSLLDAEGVHWTCQLAIPPCRLGASLPFFMNSGVREQREPKFEAFVVSVSFVCESKAGFSMSALTKTHRWCFTWWGFTCTPFPFFCLLLISVWMCFATWFTTEST